MIFTAIDFETATGYRNSACSVAIVTYETGKVVDEYMSLIKPPDNYYWYQNIDVHGITSADTAEAPDFDAIFLEVKKRLAGKTIVAHNESFDRSVLRETMALYGLSAKDIVLDLPWECTCKVYRKLGYSPVSLGVLCEELSIELDHHNALSDAKACGELYLRSIN